MSQPIIITREFSAPVEKVWGAWSVPEEAQKWWGPTGFDAPHMNIDFREGGKYLFCMRGLDTMPPEFAGKEFWSTGTYKEIQPMSKIVCTDSFSDKDGNIVSATAYGMEEMPLELLVTVTFASSEAGGTTMTLTHEGMPEAMHEQCSQGWNMSFDKLEANIQ